MNDGICSELPVQFACLNQVGGGLAQLPEEYAIRGSVVVAFAYPVTFDDLQFPLLSHDDEDVAVHVDRS